MSLLSPATRRAQPPRRHQGLPKKSQQKPPRRRSDLARGPCPVLLGWGPSRPSASDRRRNNCARASCCVCRSSHPGGVSMLPVFKFCIVHLLSLILNHIEGRSAGVAMPLFSCSAGPGLASSSPAFSHWGRVAIVCLFPSDQVTVPFPLPLFWHWAFPQPGPCSAILRFRAGVLSTEWVRARV